MPALRQFGVFPLCYFSGVLSE
ncbi:hypothetical protein CBM2634_B100132 [Cupriavidus taiwanensis]|uniref:Uncharacterized protein n=1 Tax=Cupriavidus taiwanensis TaxID=164546 RepID=A0A375J4I8_9BURK|nr:hypothetical protein CBM2634_B100132 [Cupriavidus taiwanensis]